MQQLQDGLQSLGRIPLPFLGWLQIGLTTVYSWADEAYQNKCRQKDASTTQNSVGFRISGLQVGVNMRQRVLLLHGTVPCIARYFIETGMQCL
jgi:hypothetical protein